MVRRLRHMLVKEFIQLFRDFRMRIVVFGVPLIQMLVLAFALTNDVTDVGIVISDNDKSVASRALISDFTSSSYFEIRHAVSSSDEIVRLLDSGGVRAAVVIPAGFEDDITSGETAKVQVLVDGTDSNSASIIMSYASTVVGEYSTRILVERIDRMPGPGGIEESVIMSTRAWFNPNLESKYFYVPGIIGIMLILITMLLTSIAIVREKEIGTIEQVMVTPIRRFEFIIGKMIPFTLIGYVLMTIMLGLAYVVFGVVVKGSILLLYLLTGLFLICNLGLALFISTSTSSQQQALLTAFFFMIPAILLSGFIFPVHNMPLSVQYLTWIDPLRWYIEILRGVVMKGTGIEAVLDAVIALSILGIIFVVMASVRFRKTAS